MASSTKRCGSPLLHTLMGMEVLATGSNAPENVVRNEDLVHLGMDPDWIVQRTGIRERRHAPPELATSDLCVAAGKQALERAGVARDAIDLLVLGTFTPDCQVASTAATVQDRLGLNCGAIEISSACAGFVYALGHRVAIHRHRREQAGLGHRRRLQFGGSSTRSIPRCIRCLAMAPACRHWQRVRPGSRSGRLHAGDRRFWARDALQTHGRFPLPASHASIDAGLNLLRMDGKGVFKWATRVLCDSIPDVSAHANMQLADIDLFVLHQANLRIIDAAVDVPWNPPRQGRHQHRPLRQHVGGSVPLALDEVNMAGRIGRGDRVLLSGYGAGLSWATAILVW